MYRLLYRLRPLLILLIVLGVIGAVAFVINNQNYEDTAALYYRAATVQVETAIADALNSATRTAEAPLMLYQLVAVAPNASLFDVADQYGTTLDVIQMVNGLAASVDMGDGETLIIPVGIEKLEPPRQLDVHTALAGETLELLAERFRIPQEILEADNPIIAARGVLPGDTIFVARLFSQ